MTCNTCEWFVEETDTVGDYQHTEAVKRSKGFCLVKDLFTPAMPQDKACKDYRKEDELPCKN